MAVKCVISLAYHPANAYIISMRNLIKAPEAAKYFGISIRTLYDWSSAGTVPSVKINGALRFDLDEISDWIEMNKRPVVKDSKMNDEIKL